VGLIVLVCIYIYIYIFTPHHRLLSPSFPLLIPSETVVLLQSCQINFIRSRFHIWEKIRDVCLSELGLSLNMMISSSLHFTANGIISFFLWLNSHPLYICTTFSFSSHRCWNLSWFHLLVIINSGATNMDV
jgi:hypothetical protein